MTRMTKESLEAKIKKAEEKPESVNLGSQFIAEARCFTAFLAL